MVKMFKITKKIVTFSFPKFVFFQDKKITNNQGRFFKEKKAVP